ncbi:MAG: 4-hydroxy-3-methylbut-2-enyl diphosphate reductase [Gemmatimonadota bacterium]|nr:4-hydroxy-3-methylbut-2-enyl diphosphate reductase [Gemmatimonadota bacterium]
MTAPPTPSTYFRKGFGLKAEVEGELAGEYDGRLVDLLKERDYSLTAGGVTVRLAREFGFCYGVERAVEYAYQTRRKFPEKKIYLAGEIIHNPHINRRLSAAGVIFLEHNATANEASFDFSIVEPEDVVLLPAFGVTVADFATLRERGCVMVDTTCGSVLNVWKRVESYARDGYTALIHGKYYHEETRATASQVMKYPGGRYLVVRDMGEARMVGEYLEGTRTAAEIRAKFAPHAASPGFDPARDLQRIGVANQTTMLASESLAIGAETRAAMARATGEEYAAANFRTFDTICSATQERQDAVKEMLLDPPDVMVVVGGYNSSNTISLAALCADTVPTYHIEDASCVDVSAGVIHHRVRQGRDDVATPGWLARTGDVVVGITAGASTPNNKIAETVSRVFETRGVDPRTIG